MRNRYSLLALALLLLLPAMGAAAARNDAGRISMLTGRATAAGDEGVIRPLVEGGRVFSGEVISTGPGSYLNIVFTDGGRILLRPNSRFEITRYRYSGTEPAGEAPRDDTATTGQAESDSAFFSLLKGGFRAITGLVGQRDKQDFSVRTPVATIGIRGTDFEVRLCSGDCQDISPAPRDGLYAGVFDGGIGIVNGAGEQVSLAGQYAYVAGPDIAPVPLALRPRVLAQDPMPDPAQCGE